MGFRNKQLNHLKALGMNNHTGTVEQERDLSLTIDHTLNMRKTVDNLKGISCKENNQN